MSLIVWDETYSVNNPEIDDQHKTWIDITNELHDALMNADLKRLMETAEKDLTEMRDYTRYHFMAEEAFMQAADYPDFPAHKQIHDKFYIQIKDMCTDIEEGKLVLTTDIMKTLKKWLQNHILTEDRKFREFRVA